MKKKFIIFSVICIVSLPSSGKEPEDPQIFMGIKGGWQIADDSTYQHSLPNNYLFGIYGGLQFNPSLSWDIGYQYMGALNASKTDVQTSLIESALRYDWLVSDNTSIYGRLGLAYWDMEKTNKTNKTTLEDKGFSPLGEVGISYQLTSHVYVNTGYQYIHKVGDKKIGQYDSHSLILGMSYRFGGSNNKSVYTSEIESDVIISNEPDEVQIIIDETPRVFIETMESASLTSVSFKFDSSLSIDNDLLTLADTVSLLGKYPQARIQVIGYADPTGPKSYNKKLSKKRAAFVAQQLIKQGVEPSRIDVIGAGEVELSTNASLEQRANARRVDVELLSFEYEVFE